MLIESETLFRDLKYVTTGFSGSDYLQVNLEANKSLHWVV